MLSSTSVSSIGNIHRRVIVFPFVVRSSGSVWCSERSRGGIRVDLTANAIWMADGFFFTSEHSARERRTVWDWLWQKALTRSFIRLCRSMLDADPSAWTSCLWRCAQKEAKLRSNDSPSLLWQMKDVNALSSWSSQLFTTDAEVLSSLRVKIMTVLSVELAKTTDSGLSLFATLNCLSSRWNALRSVFFVERLWKDPLCVPLEFLFLWRQPCASVLSDRGTSVTWPPWSLWARLRFQAWCLRAASL